MRVLPFGRICPDDSALHIAVTPGALAFADGIVNYGGLGHPPDRFLGAEPKAVQADSVEGLAPLLDEDFDVLLFAHGTCPLRPKRSVSTSARRCSLAYPDEVLRHFTSEARGVVVSAHEEARMLKHDWIGCEHLLLGVVGDDNGLAARVFKSLDISVERVRAQVVRNVRPPSQGAGDIQFTSAARKALELAVREGRSLGHHYVGSEHILLGLLCQDEGLATRSLSLLQTDATRLAGAAQAARPRRARFAPTDERTLVVFARATIERQEAINVGDYARARKLHDRSRMLMSIGPSRPSPERAQDAVLRRVCALLA